MVCRFFSYSLEDRIEPRHRTLVANRINMKLRYMLTGSDEEFAQRVREAVERRARFEAGKAGLETFSSCSSETSSDAEATEAAACQNSMDVVGVLQKQA
jgi:mTERF domain-containing protein, mitochondrial